MEAGFVVVVVEVEAGIVEVFNDVVVKQAVVTVDSRTTIGPERSIYPGQQGLVEGQAVLATQVPEHNSQNPVHLELNSKAYWQFPETMTVLPGQPSLQY